jgi:hypothetical protein
MSMLTALLGRTALRVIGPRPASAKPRTTDENTLSIWSLNEDAIRFKLRLEAERESLV